MKTKRPDDESDGQLIRRFAQGRDERAFAKLVERQGALVSGVCARMLKNRQDAEDAFQAVFMVLARRAHAVRRHSSLGGWLHAVAVRVCLNERKMNRRRQQRVQQAAEGACDPNEPQRLDELKLVIDEELAALPQRLREVVVLCDLEGRTRNEVARALSLPLGTVSSRLARGREVLRTRLVRQVLTIAAGGLATALAKCSQAAPAVSAELVHTTVRNSHIFLSGAAAAKTTLSSKISSLAEGALHAMFLTRLSTTVCIVALTAALVLGASPLSSLIGTRLARAQLVDFLDDFNDGSATDDQPVTWQPLMDFADGDFDASSGDLVIRPRRAIAGLLTLVQGYEPLTNTSIRAQVSVMGSNDGLVLGARASGNARTAYWGGVTASGQLEITSSRPDGRYEVLRSVASPLTPTNGDVVLQFDVIDDQLSLYAWRPGEAKPSLPQAQVIDSVLSSGTVGILVDTPQLGGTATIRYFQVSQTPIPEPSTAALGSLGFVSLAAFAFRIRLKRVRRAR